MDLSYKTKIIFVGFVSKENLKKTVSDFEISISTKVVWSVKVAQIFT